MLSADGWLDTGDLGYLIDGEIVITGRGKDLIILNGRNIWPQDLEWTAEAEVDGLRSGDVAAFSVPGGRRGRRSWCWSQARGGDADTRAALVEKIAGRPAPAPPGRGSRSSWSEAHAPAPDLVGQAPAAPRPRPPILAGAYATDAPDVRTAVTGPRGRRCHREPPASWAAAWSGRWPSRAGPSAIPGPARHHRPGPGAILNSRLVIGDLANTAALARFATGPRLRRPPGRPDQGAGTARRSIGPMSRARGESPRRPRRPGRDFILVSSLAAPRAAIVRLRRKQTWRRRRSARDFWR